jgi:hypothetical protein
MKDSTKRLYTSITKRTLKRKLLELRFELESLQKKRLEILQTLNGLYEI